MLRSSVFWQLVILPLRAVLWIAGSAGLLVGFVVQGLLSIVSGRRRFGGTWQRESMLLLREGVSGTSFDQRYVFFHPKMSLHRFREIYVEHRRYAATFDDLLVCEPDQFVVRYMGQFDPDVEIDPRSLDAEAEGFIPAPSTLADSPDDLFSIVITNQGGFGYGIRGGDRLLFRDVRRTPRAVDAADVVLTDRAMLGPAGESAQSAHLLGVLVGAIDPDGHAQELSLPRPA
ncbi:MAG: hypothetical protein R3E97_11010 [Candidatus Eisenbacteria bacterium]